MEGISLDAGKFAIRWCRVVLWQSERLRQAFEAPGPAVGLRPGFFDRIGAEQHFLLTAVSQLVRALAADGGENALPETMREPLQLLRNVREHWDEWQVDRRSPAAFREKWPDTSPWTVTRSAVQVTLAGLVSLDDLEEVVAALLDQLLQERQASHELEPEEDG